MGRTGFVKAGTGSSQSTQGMLGTRMQGERRDPAGLYGPVTSASSELWRTGIYLFIYSCGAQE